MWPQADSQPSQQNPGSLLLHTLNSLELLLCAVINSAWVTDYAPSLYL